MGMMYSITAASVAVTGAQDFFEYTAPADAIAVIHQILISQHTDVADAQEEGLVILLKRGATASGSGGASVTPAPLEFGNAAAGGVAERNNTTIASGGTISTLHGEAWNIRTPFLWLPTPEMRIVLSPSQRFTVEINTAPADSVTCTGTMVIEEIGG